MNEPNLLRRARLCLGASFLAPLLLWGASACSGSKAPAAIPPASSCDSLASCCSAMPAAEATACNAVVTADRQAGSDTACSATLQTYAQNGLCSSAGDTGFDASLPCSLTGTCAASSSGSGSGSSSGTNTNTGSSSGSQSGFDAGVNVPGDDAALPTFDASPPPPVDAGPDCGTAPVLHPETAPGVYCPFTAAGAVHCPASEQCCEAPVDAGAASSCELLGATCPFTGSTVWECDGPVDCASSDAGAVCCAAGTIYSDLACGYHRGAAFTGSHCAASCATGEVPVCDTTSDPCPAGTTCTAFKTQGLVLGTCL